MSCYLLNELFVYVVLTHFGGHCCLKKMISVKAWKTLVMAKVCDHIVESIHPCWAVDELRLPKEFLPKL